MEKRNVCVNSHEQQSNKQKSNDWQSEPRLQDERPELQDEQLEITQSDASDLSSLACSFTRTLKNGNPALLACMKVYLQSASADTLLTLLHHVEELNVRLPILRASVRVDAENGYLLVLHGLTGGEVTPENMTRFVDHLTRDFGTFLAYMRTHNVALTLSR